MLVVTIIGIAITTLLTAAGGLWAYNESVKKQFEAMNSKWERMNEVIFRRLDTNKESYWNSFVTKEVHELKLSHLTDKFSEIYKNINQKLDELIHKKE